MSRRKKYPLGRRLIIPASAEAFKMEDGFETSMVGPVYEVLIGVGKDNYARLLMNGDAYNALNEGKKLHITKATA